MENNKGKRITLTNKVNDRMKNTAIRKEKLLLLGEQVHLICGSFCKY
jgi:hypothetical protein